MSRAADPLRRLARAYGVMTRYVDVSKQTRHADDDALRAVLALLGVEAMSARDMDDALRELHVARAGRPLAPALVAWQGRPWTLVLRTRGDRTPPFRLELELEDGETRTLALDERVLLARAAQEVDGTRGVAWRFRVDERIPAGYHTLRWRDADCDALLLCAPERVHAGSEALAQNRAWGVFLPVYAIRRDGLDEPIGDLDDLAALSAWVARHGGHVVATLPMLSAAPRDPSPYSPVSRLFWNEAYLDVASRTQASGSAVPDSSRDPDAGRTPLADYARAFERVRAALTQELAEVWPDGADEPPLVRELLRIRPDADDYARFRAAWEARGESWWSWPDRLRDGELRDGDFDARAYRYHLYAQARLHERLARLAEDTRADGAGLYLDLPLGVHPDGYDVWRYRERFAAGASVGAPPDPFFTRGQDWGFPPLRPQSLRAGRFDYVTATVRNHLRYAGVLRLDHVMGLHRQFWVPNGMEASRGVYVRYPAREQYAILAIESHRHAAAIVGENLGTVPENVNVAMRRHGVRGMHVVQFDVAPDNRPMVRDPEAGAVSSLNTHDMPTFAAFWTGHDLRQRVAWGLLDEDAVAAEEDARRRIREGAARDLGLPLDGALDGPDAAADAMRAWLERLAASDASLLLVSLEDLWGELEPQNVPGTQGDTPNWRRRARLTLEQLDRTPGVTRTIDSISRLRSQRARP